MNLILSCIIGNVAGRWLDWLGVEFCGWKWWAALLVLIAAMLPLLDLMNWLIGEVRR